MDIFAVKPGERQIEILSPATKQPIGIRVTLISISDDRLKKLKRALLDERLRLESKGKHFKAENIENNLHELTFTGMVAWEWYNPTGKKGDKGFDENAALTMNGEVPAFSKKNVLEMFEKLPWFLDQIGEEMSDEQAFFPT